MCKNLDQVNSICKCHTDASGQLFFCQETISIADQQLCSYCSLTHIPQHYFQFKMPDNPKQSFNHNFGSSISTFTRMSFFLLVKLFITSQASFIKVEFTNVLPVNELCSSLGSFLFIQDMIFGSDILGPLCSEPQTIMCCAFAILSWFRLQRVLKQVFTSKIVFHATLLDGSGKRLPYHINSSLANWVTLLLLNLGWPHWVEDARQHQHWCFLLFYDYHQHEQVSQSYG